MTDHKNKCMQIIGKRDGKMLECGKPCQAICCDTCQAASIVEWEILRLDMRRHDHQEWAMLSIKRLDEMSDISTAMDFLNVARGRNAEFTRKSAAMCVTAGQCGQPDASYFLKGKERARRMAELMRDGTNPLWLGIDDDRRRFRQAQENRATRTNKRVDDGGTAMQDTPQWQPPKAPSENFSNV